MKADPDARQASLFDQPPSLPPKEQKRLSRQCVEILDRLRQGDLTNIDLIRMAFSYTRRISDLRQAGFDVEVVSRDHDSGISTYRLKERT